MPSDTFLNLPDAKRERILDALFDEFSSHSYGLASTNRIASTLGIAKGSIFQYFGSKRDIYMYLVDLVVKAKFKYVEAAALDPAADMFTVLRGMILASAAFARDNPRYVAFFSRLLEEKDTQELGDLTARLHASSEAYITRMVASEAASGRLRPDLDQGLAAFVINRMIIEFGTYLRRRTPGAHPTELEEREVDALIDMLRHGLAAR